MADYTHLSNINVQGYVTSSGQGTLLGSFETMPAASAQNAGQIVLYTGATNSTYTKGKYYKSNGSGWSEYDAGQVSESVLEGYVPKDGSKVLSTNDYTTPEKNKLAGIATGAQVNVIEKVNVTNTSGVTSALPITDKGVTVDLSTLATKSDVSAIPKFAVTLVDTLPASGSTSTIYLKSNGGASGNSYDEYLYYNNAWEKIGSTDVDLTAYAKTEDVNSALAGKQDTITAGSGLSKSGSTLSLAASGVTAGSKGSTTQVPVITVDQYGRVTSMSTSTIYPPTSVGTNGQYWKSDGSGQGVWQSLDTTPTSGSANAVTSGAVYSAINNKVPTSGTFSEDESSGDGQIAFKNSSGSTLFTVTGISGGGSSSTANVAVILEENTLASFSGVVVTATPAVGSAQTATSDSSGIAVFKGLAQGQWTFSANMWQSQTASLVGGFQTSITLKAEVEVYGCSIAISDPSPSARVTYPSSIFNQTNKADGKTPASGTGSSCMNGWANCNLISGIHRQKGNSTSGWTDISNTAAWQTGSGTTDIVTYVPTWYFKMENTGSSVDLAFASQKIDDTWQDLAGSVGTNRVGHFRVGCFAGYVSSSNLYSRGSVTPTVSTSITNFITYAKARGTGYDIMTWYQWMYLTALAVLLYKSTDLQSAMAGGYVGGTSVQTESSLTWSNAYGMAGSTGTSSTAQMSFFWIQNLWGNMYQFVGGAKTDSSRRLMTCTGYSSVTDSDFDKTALTATLSSSLSGYISKVTGTTDTGFFPSECSGSGSTYFADGGRVYASGFPYVGGNYDGGDYAGPFRALFSASATETDTYIGSRLSYRL